MADVTSSKIEFDDKGATPRYNLVLNQHADNFIEFSVVGSGGTTFNLSGYGFSGAIRKHIGASSTETDTINLGFNTGGRSVGIITAEVAAGVTSNFSKISPRYTYDIITTDNTSGVKRKLVTGNVNVDVGVTKVGGGGTDDSDDILGSNRVCIAVIDESSSAGSVDSANTASNAVTVSEYNAFRATFPNRRHYILQPTPTGVAKTEAIMTDAVKAVYVSGFTDGRQVQGVNRDGGDAAEASDWFNIIGISTMNITKLALFIDTSGSMNLATIAASRAKFIGTCTANGITIREEDNGDEDWIEPFTGILA